MDIKENLNRIKATLPAGVKLVAVSKTHPAEMLLEVYDAGQRVFGENKVQEMTAKSQVLPKDIEWHFIGHVQSNKIKLMAPYVSVIQGVDTYDKLAEIDRQATRFGRHITCLLQLHIAQEETKFGFAPEELLTSDILHHTSHFVRICGIMGMASNTPDETRVRADFRRIRQVFESLKSGEFADRPEFKEVSMGMSHDYQIAVDEGSTMVRIGSSIFGARDYSKLKA